MYEYRVTSVSKVVDGDTVDLVLDLGFGLFKKERVRVAGIDTPESRTRDLVEKKYGLEAKVYLQGMLENAENLTVKTEKDGKYGRMLGWLYAGDLNINQRMLDAGYGFPYDGGKKLTGDNRWTYLEEKRKEWNTNHKPL